MARCLYVEGGDGARRVARGLLVLCVCDGVSDTTDVTVNGKPRGIYEGVSSPSTLDHGLGTGLASRTPVLGVDNGRGTAGHVGHGHTSSAIGVGLAARFDLEARPLWVADVLLCAQVATSRAVLRVTVMLGGIRCRCEIGSEGVHGSSRRCSAPAAGALLTMAGGSKKCDRCDIPRCLSNPRLGHRDDRSFTWRGSISRGQGRFIVEASSRGLGIGKSSRDGSKLLLIGKPLYLSGFGDDATERSLGMFRLANRALPGLVEI